MFFTCDKVAIMSKMIQIRNVPEDLHRKLKAKAARLEMTLSGYLLSEIEEIAEKPTMQEWLELVSQLEPTQLDESPAETIRRLRDSR